MIIGAVIGFIIGGIFGFVLAAAIVASGDEGNYKQSEGEWIGIEYDGYADGVPVYDVWECSACGNEWRGDETPCYCPDCGAKMKGGA